MKLIQFTAAMALALAAIGCGGGGSGSGGGGTNPAGSTPLFVTDSLDDHSHVWVSIEKVVLKGPQGEATVFSDPGGKQTDLKSLRDANGARYAFLTNIPAGTYSEVDVVVGKTLTLFNNGSNVGLVREFAGNDGVRATLSLKFAQPKQLDPNRPLTIDFNLADWNDDGVTVTGAPFLKEGNGVGINNLDRHQDEDYKGTVQGLAGTAPNQTFKLTLGVNTVAVIVSADTVIVRESAGNPVLADGQRVEVRGAYSTARSAIEATSVKIEDASHANEDEARGAVSNFDANAGTFTLSVQDAEGFIPTSANVTVLTNESTTYRSHRGVTLTKAEFFAELQTAGFAEVEGVYDATANTFTARKVKLEDEAGGEGHHGGHNGGGDHQEAEAVGTLANLDGTAGTFDLTPTKWEGINLAPGSTIHVTTTAGTEFDGVSRANFFSSTVTGPVKVEGDFDADTNTLAAREIKVGDGSGGGHGSDD
jgi:hypothetical protein